MPIWSMRFRDESVRDFSKKAARKMYVDMYRTRNKLNTDNLYNAFNFLGASYNGTVEDIIERGYITFTTLATPRGVDTNVGVDELIRKMNTNTRAGINLFCINTVNNKEIGDALFTEMNAQNAINLKQYKTVLTKTPYNRVELLHRYTASEGYTQLDYILFTNSLDDETVLRLAGCVCAHLNAFDNDTIDVANMILSHDQQAYENYIVDRERIIRRERFLNTLHSELEKVEKARVQTKLNRINSELSDELDAIESLEADLAKRYAQATNLRKQALMLTTNDAPNTELKEFLEANSNNITFIRVIDDKLYLRYRTPLLYWEEDLFEMLYRSTGLNPVTALSEARKEIVYKIFKTREIKLWMDSGFEYNLSRPGFAHKTMVGSFTKVPEQTGLYNPHHFYYNCWGDNKAHIIKAQTEGNDVIALAQIFAAIAGINMSDNAVLSKFFREEFKHCRKIACLELNDTHEIITIEEYERRYHAEHQTNE